MVDLCLEAVQESEVIPEHNVLFLIDEAYTLGYSKNISEAFGLMGGNGLRVWPIFQNLGQIQKIYKEKEWETFISGSCIQLFGVNDYNTAKYFSDTFGNHGTVQSSHTAGSQSGATAGENEGESKAGNNSGSQRGKSKGESLGKTHSIVKRALITPDEIMRIDKNIIICSVEGDFPLKVQKLKYYEQEDMIDIADPNPYRND
ncbi:MAG: type IV secretory system conjugative DNA transfer family protein [Oleispira sp.]|nr:type IV secretory system conjugative DNA transfer family protein [Oleispira sp.]